MFRIDRTQKRSTIKQATHHKTNQSKIWPTPQVIKSSLTPLPQSQRKSCTADIIYLSMNASWRFHTRWLHPQSYKCDGSWVMGQDPLTVTHLQGRWEGQGSQMRRIPKMWRPRVFLRFPFIQDCLLKAVAWCNEYLNANRQRS